MDYSPPLCPLNSLGKNTGVGCHSHLQGIFPNQVSNPGLLHCRQTLYHLSHQGSPYAQLEIVKKNIFKPIFDLLCSCVYSEDSILESKEYLGLACVSPCGLGGLSETSHHYSWWGYRPLPSGDGLTEASTVLWLWALLETTFRGRWKIFWWVIFHIWVYFPAFGDADSDVFGNLMRLKLEGFPPLLPPQRCSKSLLASLGVGFGSISSSQDN